MLRRVFLTHSIILLVLLTGFFYGQIAMAGKIKPDSKLAALSAQQNQVYDFILLLRDDETITQDIETLVPPGKKAVNLPIIQAVAVSLRVRDAIKLAERDDVDQVWYLHPDEAPITIRTIQSLDYLLKTMPLPNLANLSLGPPPNFYIRRPDTDAPVIRALEAAAERGLVVVVAMGNEGKKAPGYVNPWSTAPSVISVGAWDHSTNSAWVGSSTADPSEVAAWPDVIAPGVDVIGPWTSKKQKTERQRTLDENNRRFRENVPREDWNKYSLMSGTSQAAAVVSGAAAQVLRFLRGFIDEHKRSPGDILFSLQAGPERVTRYDREAPRFTGTALKTDDGGMLYEYRLDAPWKIVKQILIDTAIPVERGEPWEVGAGLVDPDYINAQFGAYGAEPPKLLPVKVK